MPVHCIVWGKELYKLLFADKVEDSMLFEDENVGKDEENEGGAEEEKKDTSGDDAQEDDEEPSGPSTYMDLVNILRTLLQSKDATTEEVQEQATKVLTALYITEINKQIGMGRYKTANKVPAPLDQDDIDASSQTGAPTTRDGYDTTDIWSQKDCTAELVACIVQAHDSYKAEEAVAPAFDKDDEMAMRFVTASANLRQYVFKIDPIQSLYSAKGIAGNIIPAIATTNAIVAGLQVLQAFHILRVQLEAEESGDASKKEEEGRYKECCRYQYCLRNFTRKGYLLQPSKLPEPNSKCFVCRSATVDVTLDTASWTMKMLLSKIIKGELGFAQPTIMINGDIVYEEGDGAEEDYVCNLPKTLTNLPAGGIQGGTVVRVEDYSQDLEVDLSFAHKDDWSEEEWKEKDADQKYIIGGDKPVVAAPAAGPASSEQSKEAEKKSDDKGEEEDDDDDDEIIIEEVSNDPPTKPSGLVNGDATKKRKAGDDADDGVPDAKKSKVATNDDVEVIELD